MKIYVAGPMRGYEDDNRAAFKEARDRWKAQGHTVFCPHSMTEALGLTDKESRTMAMRLDFTCLEHADGVAVLSNWEKSVGATLEVAYAHFLGLPIYDAETGKMIDPVRCPWYELASIRNRPKV